jgi:dephospho-CoA kinase
VAQSTPIRTFGLTGGIASGKSLVSQHFRALGVPVIDADALAREVVEPGSEALAEIANQFGADMLRDGALDRKRLAEAVFSRPDQLRRLEDITHPRIQALRSQRLRELAAQGEPLAGCEVPLLYEKGMEAELRPVVVVHVPEPVQLARAMARDGSTKTEARARIAAQWPLEDKVRRADYAIDNSGSPEATRAAAEEVLGLMCEALGVDAARYLGTHSQRTGGGGGSVSRA